MVRTSIFLLEYPWTLFATNSDEKVTRSEMGVLGAVSSDV